MHGCYHHSYTNFNNGAPDSSDDGYKGFLKGTVSLHNSMSKLKDTADLRGPDQTLYETKPTLCAALVIYLLRRRYNQCSYYSGIHKLPPSVEMF